MGRMDDAGFFFWLSRFVPRSPFFFSLSRRRRSPGSRRLLFLRRRLIFLFLLLGAGLYKIFCPPLRGGALLVAVFSPQTAPGLIGWAFSFSFVFVGGFLFG